MILTRRKTEAFGVKPVPVTLSTTNLIRTGLGLNPSFRVDRPTTNGLSFTPTEENYKWVT